MDTAEIIKQQLKELGVEVKADVQTIRTTLASVSRLLIGAKSEPDFAGSVQAASDILLQTSVQRAVSRADSADARALTFLDGVIFGKVLA